MKLINRPKTNRFFQLGALAVAMLSSSLSAETYKLADLPYAFDALEPHIDAKTMEIHHGKHHAAYVNNLNKALESDAKLAEVPLADLLADLPAVSDDALRNTLRNNGGGHWNHDFFWNILVAADKSGEPSKELAAAIDEAFGSFEDFQTAFAAAAATRFGSGWAWLIVQDGKLKITSTANQDNPLMKGLVPDADLGTPVLGLDVWEHAYYLHYQNRRADYSKSFWAVINWEAVSKHFADATK